MSVKKKCLILQKLDITDVPKNMVSTTKKYVHVSTELSVSTYYYSKYKTTLHTGPKN